MIIADGVAVFALPSSVLGHRGTVYVSFIWDREKAVLIDTGFPNHSTDIIREIESITGSAELLKRIIFTHQDIDHIGGGPGILSSLPGHITTTCHREDAPYIEGRRRLIKFSDTGISMILGSLPADVSAEKRAALEKALTCPPSLPISEKLEGDTRLHDCGGLSVICTPGHTPGHICVYHHPTKSLIAGDCIDIKDGKLSPPNKDLCSDYFLALDSLKRLKDYDIETIVSYHNGILREGVNDRIRSLLSEIHDLPDTLPR